MKLSVIFSQLAYGELSQLSMVSATPGQIDEASYGSMVAHVNLGLTALHKRFPLKEGRLTFNLQEGRAVYPLTTNDDVSFVADPLTDFSDDILKIEGVFTAGGTELSLNDRDDPYSCMTPSDTVLRVPLAIAAQSSDLPSELITPTLEVVYRANHPIIVQGTGAWRPERIEVALPYSHLEALLLFVASRVHNPIGMVNEFNAGNNYAAKYEHACALLETHNLRVDQGSSNSRLQQRGFV